MIPKIQDGPGWTLTGDGMRILARRGTVETRPDGLPVLITLHPSYLLRVRDPAARDRAKEQFRQDLMTAAGMIAQDAS